MERALRAEGRWHIAPGFDLDFIGFFYRVYLEDTPTVCAPPGPPATRTSRLLSI